MEHIRVNRPTAEKHMTRAEWEALPGDTRRRRTDILPECVAVFRLFPQVEPVQVGVSYETQPDETVLEKPVYEDRMRLVEVFLTDEPEAVLPEVETAPESEAKPRRRRTKKA